MKRSLLVLALLGVLNFSARAAVGDTTWVQAHSTVQLTHYGNFDTTITFPTAGATPYRNIYMIVTFGKYVCPGSPTYCGDWDYTIQNYLMTPGGDTLELGRLITPYANAGAPRTPMSWKQHYIYDVTDYVSKLAGSATMRLAYSGYSWGFTADIKFAFIEGTPDRDVKSVERLWHGSFGYGGATSINTHFPAVTRTAPTGSASSALKFTVTGHGSDANGCCEFLSKNYDVMLDSASIATKAIWKTCGTNELYPQSGTWIYDRANWCPGERTNDDFYTLPGISADSTYNLALQFEPYTVASPSGSYTTEATLFNYGPLNKMLDGAITDIISPTNDENHFRENPICSAANIKVKNRGSNTITSMQIAYGLDGGTMATYSWTGSLAPLTESVITLPDLADLHTLAGSTGLNTFVAQITSVNGSADSDITNNIMKSQFVPSPKWDSTFKIVFKTNNEPVTTGSTISESKWEIFDASGTVVASRTNADMNTLYTDTVSLPTGCYKLQITDGGCDGLNWWGFASAGITAGTFVPKKMSNAIIPMNGYNYGGSYNNDFGCVYTQYFYTTSTPNGVTEISTTGVQLEAYPNPAKNSVNINIDGVTDINGTLQIIDAVGRTVVMSKCTTASAVLNTESLANGIYTIQFVNANGNKLQTRLLIAK